jgi:hypothetical protein
MAKATTIKEAIKRFEDAKQVTAAEQEKAQLNDVDENHSPPLSTGCQEFVLCNAGRVVRSVPAEREDGRDSFHT